MKRQSARAVRQGTRGRATLVGDRETVEAGERVIHELTISLLASRAVPAAVSDAEFLSPLGVSATDAMVVMGPDSSRIELAAVTTNER
jgi:hypothetical protein